MVKYLRDEFKKKRNIMTNLVLNQIRYSDIDVNTLLDGTSDIQNVVLGIDELTVYADCRMSLRKANLFFSYLILQSRKRDMDVYYTTQNLDMIDKRVVEHTFITVLAEKLFNKKGEEFKNYRMFTIFDKRNSFKPHIVSKIMDIRPFYKYYDTNQIIKPIL